MTTGTLIWLALAVLAGALVLVGALARRVPSVADVVHWWLESWLGRLVLLALWAEAGFHVFTQRP
ncbi:MAG: hypothetical protein M0004_06520 [Actinomycetota bacterium]|nr:hypothetical protein [Actinomycetota bacterium]